MPFTPGRIRPFLPVPFIVVVVGPAFAQNSGVRTIEFQTTQVTAPNIAVSPDDQWLVFTMLGKLFRVPARGGDAEQLTTGPFYDADPAISPEGRLIAFHSDRDGSEGNIFLLDLQSRAIQQMTREAWADRPAWSPDGQWLAYLRLERERWNPVGAMDRPPATIRRVRASGGEPETVRPLDNHTSVFYLPDGRLGWTIVMVDSAGRLTSRIEVMDDDGAVRTRHSRSGLVRSVVPSPRGTGFYVSSPNLRPYDAAWQPPRFSFVPLDGSAERLVAPASGELAVARNDSSLYSWSFGHLSRLSLPDRRRALVPFRATVRLEVQAVTPAPRWRQVDPGSDVSAVPVSQPRLSPDGSRVVFRLFGRLWHQPLAGREAARRVVADSAGSERDAAFSPDGRQLAFVRTSPDRQEIMIMDLRSGAIRTLGAAAECAYEYLSWSAGRGLVAATGCQHEHRVVAIDPSSGMLQPLAATSRFEAFPLVPGDGRALFYLFRDSSGVPGYYRHPLEALAQPQRLFRLSGGAEDGLAVTTSGRWIASGVPNRPGIRLARLGATGLTGEERVIADADGVEFEFTPDGSALVYSDGARVWREPVDGGRREEIPIRNPIRAATPPPTLVRRVRMLDFAAGGFGPETSVLIENGRIARIGAVDGGVLPAGTVTVDGGGRFAIPGLFDSHGHSGCGGANYIAFGVTSIRDMGGRIEHQTSRAFQSELTGAAVPRCFFSGRILEGPRGRSRNEDWFFLHVQDEADIRAQVRRLHARGAQFVKLYNMVPWRLQRAAADEARKLGLPVVAHGIDLEQTIKGLTHGFAGLNHWSQPVYDDISRLSAATGTWWEPTLGWSPAAGLELAFRRDPERYRRAERGLMRPMDDNTLGGIYAERLRTLAAARRRGVVFLPGTDAGPAGLTLLWELEFYSQAGLAPLEVLRLATQAAAQSVGAGIDLGTLEEGKLADIVLLDADPLQDIRNVHAIWRVIKGGWMFDPDVLAPNRNN